MTDQIPVAPCAGKWMLFDSSDINDHKEAAKLCATCPIVDQCRDALDDELGANRSGKSGAPVGTWAGALVRNHVAERTQPVNPAVEDAMFSDEEAAAAADAYRSGERTDRAIVGNRVHRRRRLEAVAKPPPRVRDALALLANGWSITDAAREVEMTRAALDQALCRWRKSERARQDVAA